MSLTSQPTQLVDLYTDLITRIRDQIGVTPTTNIAKRYLNIALRDMHIAPGNIWPWQLRRSNIITHPIYTTGTIAIAASSRSTVTGTGTLWNTAVTGYGYNNARAGGKLDLGGNNEIYTISSVTNDTTLTLVETFAPSTVPTAGNYTYFEDEYSLPSDFHRPADFRNFSTDLNIRLIGPREFRRRYVRNRSFTMPYVATIIQLAFSGGTAPPYRVVFHPAPDQAYQIPFYYQTNNLAVTTTGTEQTDLVNDTDEPIVPLMYRHAIIYHALANWYRDRKDDTRSQEAMVEYTGIMQRMAKDINTFPTDRPRIQPISSSVRTPIRRSQRYDINGRFDRLQD